MLRSAERLEEKLKALGVECSYEEGNVCYDITPSTNDKEKLREIVEDVTTHASRKNSIDNMSVKINGDYSDELFWAAGSLYVEQTEKYVRKLRNVTDSVCLITGLAGAGLGLYLTGEYFGELAKELTEQVSTNSFYYPLISGPIESLISYIPPIASGVAAGVGGAHLGVLISAPYRKFKERFPCKKERYQRFRDAISENYSTENNELNKELQSYAA